MIVVNQEDCIRCGACEGTCPTTAAIKLDNNNVVYCDMCSDEPKCVDACPNGALGTDELLIDENAAPQKRITYNPIKCNACGDCVAVCPPQTLELCDCEDSFNLNGYCVMCQKCVNICPVDVVGISEIKEPKTRDLKLTENIFIQDCVGCELCVGGCPTSAITLEEVGGEISIDEDACAQCGLCSRICPWNAVYIAKNPRPHKRSKEIKEFTLDENTCIGCNVCVDACPGDFIEGNSRLTVDLPSICAACTLCEKLCPVDAINLDVEWQ